MYAAQLHTCSELNCIPEFQSSIGYIIEEPGFAPEVTRPFSPSFGVGSGHETRVYAVRHSPSPYLLLVASLHALGTRLDRESRSFEEMTATRKVIVVVVPATSLILLIGAFWSPAGYRLAYYPSAKGQVPRLRFRRPLRSHLLCLLPRNPL